MASSTGRSRAASLREQLTIELAGYLFSPPERGQPIVLRRIVGRTTSQNLYVFWDKWKGIPLEERTEIILAANDALEGTVKVDISLAAGRTIDEAIALGYLPFRIVPVENEMDEETWERAEAAMRAEGAAETSNGLQLRFASPQDAREAYVRLQRKLPGPFWILIEEQVRDD